MNDPNSEQIEPLTVSPQLAQRVNEVLGQNVYLCYQCAKCTSGCPVGSFFDWQPNQIMRLVQLGQEETVFTAKTPWLCASCQTCTTRCPQNLDIAGIMDFLVHESLERGYAPQIPEGEIFIEAFMREVRIWGRAYELGLLAELKLRTRNITGDLELGLKMIQKGKLSFMPHPAKSPHKIEPLPRAAAAVAYYPGCSLHSTAPEFDLTSRAVCQALDIELIEPPGWVCCGSSAAHRAEPEEAYRLPMSNLSLFEQYGFNEVTMPCAACFNRHKFAEFNHKKKAAEPHENGNSRGSHSTEAPAKTAYPYEGRLKVNTLHATLLEHAGLEMISARKKKDLSRLKAVCYYGCLLTRPSQVTEDAHPENPMELDVLMKAAGLDVVDWSYKTTCCGAAHSLTRPEIVWKLTRELIDHAREVSADLIVVACPLCHMNLDGRQFQLKLEKPMPILFFTQVLCLALGLPYKTAQLEKNLVSPISLLQTAGVLAENIR